MLSRSRVLFAPPSVSPVPHGRDLGSYLNLLPRSHWWEINSECRMIYIQTARPFPWREESALHRTPASLLPPHSLRAPSRTVPLAAGNRSHSQQHSSVQLMLPWGVVTRTSLFHQSSQQRDADTSDNYRQAVAKQEPSRLTIQSFR